MQKEGFLKARVSLSVKSQFERVCATRKMLPSAQLRQLIEAFVNTSDNNVLGGVHVDVYRPEGYDEGAWRAVLRLADSRAMEWLGEPVPFAFPRLSRRRFQSDEGYRSVVKADDGELALGGRFVAGEWWGYVYSNGCPESANPTPIAAVREALTSAVLDVIGRGG